jgi:hypothetical protein
MTSARDIDPDRAAAGLAAYNDMLNAWAADGISTPLSGSALSYSLDDAFPLAPQFVEGAKALLAVELALQSGIEPQPSLQERAQKSREALLAYHVIAPNAGQDTGLTWMPSLRRYGFR